MHRTARLAVATLALATLAIAAPSAAVEQGGVRMELLIDGRPAEELPARGTRYVQAFRNKEYAVRLTNDTNSRVAIALAVDGLNSVDARHTTAADSTKWVLGPWESLVVEGWQVGREQARKFLFTTEQKSYGEWLGDTRNLGIISAVAFTEKRRAVVRRPAPEPWYHCCRGDVDEQSSDASGWGGAENSRKSAEGRSRDSEEAPAASSRSGVGSQRAEAPKDHAATGIGRRVENEVEWVEFEMDTQPIASLDLRYGFRDELISLGVLPRPHQAVDRRESAGGFAPDPGRSVRR